MKCTGQTGQTAIPSLLGGPERSLPLLTDFLEPEGSFVGEGCRLGEDGLLGGEVLPLLFFFLLRRSSWASDEEAQPIPTE